MMEAGLVQSEICLESQGECSNVASLISPDNLTWWLPLGGKVILMGLYLREI